VAATLSETLANLAYMFVDEAPPGEWPPEGWLEARISYSGAASGELRLRCTHGLALKLSANLLGIEPDETAAALGTEDAVREFANVLGGQLVTSLYNTQDVFNLSVPDLQRPQHPEPLPPGAEVVRVQVEGSPVELSHLVYEHCPPSK